MTGSRTFLASLMASMAGLYAAQAANKPGESSIVEGQALAAELRSEKPTENLEIKGVLKIRNANGKRVQVPFRYRIVVGETSWQGIYETQGGAGLSGEKLVVVHTDDKFNRYLVSKALDNDSAGPVSLSGDKAMASFANSDFWLADLGLEFLHWPQQRIVEEAKIKMRKGRPCKVLESINPHQDAAGYTRVRSWIDTKTGKPILAEAYGPNNKLLKEFEVGNVTKVNGQWELKNMEMRNAQTDSQTVLEFKYEQKAGE